MSFGVLGKPMIENWNFLMDEINWAPANNTFSICHCIEAY